MQALSRIPRPVQVTGLRGIILDLTLRKQEAQALHESRERLKLAVTAGDLGIWDVDLRTMAVHDINEWANRALDLSFEDSAVITITQCKTLVHPLDLPRILFAFFRDVALKAPLFEVEFRLPHRDGSWRWVAVRGKVIERNARNEPVRFTGTINTIAPPKESRYLLSGPQ